MPTETPRILLELHYEQAAQEYLRKLPLEQIMEAPPQATQRKITLESLDLVHRYRPDVQFFNELLVQYPSSRPRPRRKKPEQVVPDNMVVLHDQPLKLGRSYDVVLQPVRPFWMLEYVSKTNPRKDYDDNMRKYEQELKVPYYLLFAPEEQELTLYQHTGERYSTVLPNEHGRYALPQLELEVALLDGWVRFWFRGELLPLPPDLLQKIEEEQRARLAAERRAEEAHERAEQAQERAERERQRAEQAQERAERERQRADALAAELERLRQQLAQRGE